MFSCANRPFCSLRKAYNIYITNMLIVCYISVNCGPPKGLRQVRLLGRAACGEDYFSSALAMVCRIFVLTSSTVFRMSLASNVPSKFKSSKALLRTYNNSS